MYALGHSGVSKATILYPTIDEIARIEKIDMKDAISGHYNGTIVLQPINVYELEKLISSHNHYARQEFALSIIA